MSDEQTDLPPPPPIRTPIEEPEEEQADAIETNRTETRAEGEVAAAWHIPPEWGIQALAFLHITTTLLQDLSSFLWRVGKGVWKSVQPETYIFFEGSDVPYNKNDLNLTAPGVAPIRWYYDAKLHTFISSHLFDTSDHIHFSHLPYLSVEIKYDSLLLHDVTEFMEKIRWAGDASQEPPPPSKLLAVWALESGIVLEKSNALRFCVIDQEGNERTIPLR